MPPRISIQGKVNAKRPPNLMQFRKELQRKFRKQRSLRQTIAQRK